MEQQCVRKSIRWCGRSLLAFQICGTSKECRATCLKPYCAIQIAGPLARAPVEMAGPVHSTRRRSQRHQVPVGDQSSSWSSQLVVVLRCWSVMLVCDCERCVLVVVAPAAATGSRISNLKCQSSQAIRRGCVLLCFGSQKRRPANYPYKRKIAS